LIRNIFLLPGGADCRHHPGATVVTFAPSSGDLPMTARRPMLRPPAAQRRAALAAAPGRHGRWRAVVLVLALAAGLPAAGKAAPGVDEPTGRLFAAVEGNDLPAAQQAIAAGADIEARNAWGATPAEVAVDKGYYRIAHYLVSIRNFQRTRPETAAAPPAGGEAGARAALGTAGLPAAPAARVPTGAPAATTAGPAGAVPATAAGSVPQATPMTGGDPFDPARPAYGTGLPAGGRGG
jgi:hypothetical protein